MIKRGLLGVLLVLSLVLLGIAIQGVQAEFSPAQDNDDVTQGAMLYDRWFAALGVDAPAGNMPLWALQSTNTRSGPETWRCVTCHGWDYQGREGAYRYGSNFTGFPGVYQVRGKSQDEIIGALKGAQNPEHDFSAYLDDTAMKQLATFLNTALIDDNEFIDPQTLAVKGGDAAHGKQLFDSTCASCHGEDGQKITIRFEGRDAWLGTLATLDPWRFLHKTRFGTPGTEMPVGYSLGWSAQDGRDALLYARSLPSGLEVQEQQPSMPGRIETPPAGVGGPANSIFTGILTALGAMATSLGFALLVGLILVAVIFLLVWIVRGQKK